MNAKMSKIVYFESLKRKRFKCCVSWVFLLKFWEMFLTHKIVFLKHSWRLKGKKIKLFFSLSSRFLKLSFSLQRPTWKLLSFKIFTATWCRCISLCISSDVYVHPVYGFIEGNIIEMSARKYHVSSFIKVICVFVFVNFVSFPLHIIWDDIGRV